MHEMIGIIKFSIVIVKRINCCIFDLFWQSTHTYLCAECKTVIYACYNCFFSLQYNSSSHILWGGSAVEEEVEKNEKTYINRNFNQSKSNWQPHEIPINVSFWMCIKICTQIVHTQVNKKKHFPNTISILIFNHEKFFSSFCFGHVSERTHWRFLSCCFFFFFLSFSYLFSSIIHLIPSFGKSYR